MQLIISSVEANKIFFIKKDSDEITKYIEVVNPQYIGGSVLFDIHVNLPDNFNITTRLDGIEQYIVITLGKLGSFELNVKDYRDLTIY